MRGDRTNKQIVLDTLVAAHGSWVSGTTLVEAGAGWRYGGRIYELRQAGHTIEERRDPEKRSAVHQYRLVGGLAVAGQVALPWGESHE